MEDSDDQLPRQKLIEFGRKIVSAGLVVAKQGNLSVRLPGQKAVLITASKVPYEVMRTSDLPVLSLNGELIGPSLPPSKETPIHLAVYRARKDVAAIIHTHSPFATAVSALRENVPPFLEEQVPYLGGGIKTAKYAMSGTDPLAANVVRALGDRNAVLLANHGALTCGRDLESAFRNALLAERISQIYILARSVGKPSLLPRYAIGRQMKRYQTVQKEALEKLEADVVIRSR